MYISEASAPAWEMRDSASVVHHIYTCIKNTYRHRYLHTCLYIYVHTYNIYIYTCTYIYIYVYI